MMDWKDEAIQLIREAEALARLTENQLLEGSCARVLDAMAAEGACDAADRLCYAMIMEGLLASGLLQSALGRNDF